MIQSGSLQCCKNIAPWSSVSSLGIVKRRGRFQLSTDSNAYFLLITAHQPWHIFCCIGLLVELVWQNSLAHSTQQSNIVANIFSHSSPVFQDSLLHFLYIFGHGSGLMSFRTLIIGWHPSILETLKPFVGWRLAQGFITKCFCKHFVCSCSHFAESEAEFDADRLLLHISHFSRLVRSQDSTNRMSEKCTEKKHIFTHGNTIWQAGSQRVQLAICSSAQLYYKWFSCDIQILGTRG